MTTAEFKRVGRLLKTIYAELEQEALKDGVDVFGEEFIEARDAVRAEVLRRLGFTLEEYREAKELVAPAKKVEVAQQVLEASTIAQEASNRLEALEIPDEEDLLEKARIIAEGVVKPPVIQNNIVREKVIEKPTIVHTTVKETVNEEYNDGPLMAEIGYLNERIDSIKIPEVPDLDALVEEAKQDLKSEFMEELQRNINMLGMPDFRKLAMGLQSQIDEVRSQTGTGTGTPAGADTQIQFNDAGAFGAIAGISVAYGDTLRTNYLEVDEIWNVSGQSLDITTLNATTPQDINITAGASTTSNTGASVLIAAGAGTTTAGGNGGFLSMRGGSVPVGGDADGGSSFFYAGTGRGAGNTGGDIVFEAGAGANSATAGNIKFRRGSTGTYAVLDTSAVATTDKTLTVQNASGTIALTAQTVDYEVTDTTKGIILKSPDGTRWRISVTNAGVLTTTSL